MGKPKRRQAMPSPAIEARSPCESELDGEDSWVIVKKQQVTILVPPRSITSEPPKPKACSIEAMTVKTVGDNSTALIETSVRVPSVDDAEETTKQLASQKYDRFDWKSRHIQSSVKPRFNAANETTNANPGNTLRPSQVPGLPSISTTMKQAMIMHGQPRSFLDRSLVLDQRLRTMLIEKKLRRAGGLSKWLESLGLEQFVEMFQGRSTSKFLLVNLTMNKLQHMGVEAVGPRRKLMHAIDCICQPCCFQTRQRFAGSPYKQAK